MDKLKANPFCGIEIPKDIIPKIYFQKYGVDNPNKNKEVRDKIRRTLTGRKHSENCTCHFCIHPPVTQAYRNRMSQIKKGLKHPISCKCVYCYKFGDKNA